MTTVLSRRERNGRPKVLDAAADDDERVRDRVSLDKRSQFSSAADVARRLT